MFLPIFCDIFTACANDFFGEGCLQRCLCQNGAECDPVSGSCICSPGWKGAHCNKRESHLFYKFDADEQRPLMTICNNNCVLHPHCLEWIAGAAGPCWLSPVKIVCSSHSSLRKTKCRRSLLTISNYNCFSSCVKKKELML